MNRVLIPSILTVIVAIAGIFAFYPIDEASTVHTTIITATGEHFRIAQAGAMGTSGVSTYTLTCTEACIVENITTWTTAGEDSDVTFIVNVSGPVDVLKVDLTAPDNNALGDLSIGGGVSNQVDVLLALQARAPAGVDQMTPLSLSVAPGGSVIVELNNSDDGDGSVSAVVVFTGKNLGNTDVTTAFVA